MPSTLSKFLNKSFSIAFFLPAFITLLSAQLDCDIVAGTIVVKRNRLR